MRHVILLRHAKAVSKATDRDFDRVLAPEGRREMVAIAAALARLPGRPALALVSPAARTRETWQLANLPGVPTRFVDEIYEAETETLLGLLFAEGGEGTTVLVGHNPAISDAAARLLAPASARAVGHLPTAAFALIGFDGDVAAGEGQIERLVTPASARVGEG